jgi:hypothetical protein
LIARRCVPNLIFYKGYVSDITKQALVTCTLWTSVQCLEAFKNKGLYLERYQPLLTIKIGAPKDNCQDLGASYFIALSGLLNQSHQAQKIMKQLDLRKAGILSMLKQNSIQVIL